MTDPRELSHSDFVSLMGDTAWPMEGEKTEHSDIMLEAGRRIMQLEDQLRDAEAEIDALVVQRDQPKWLPMQVAPRGVWSEYRTDEAYVPAPKILMLFEDDEQAVCYWDWYYAEGGNGYEPGYPAWVESTSGALAAQYYGEPKGWMHLPQGLPQ